MRELNIAAINCRVIFSTDLPKYRHINYCKPMQNITLCLRAVSGKSSIELRKRVKIEANQQPKNESFKHNLTTSKRKSEKENFRKNV